KVHPGRFIPSFVKGNRRAFTLLEVMISILVLEIGLLGIAAFYASSFKVTRQARNQTIAGNLSAGLLDAEMAIAYDNLPVGPGLKERYSTDASNPFYNWSKKIDVAFIDSNLTEQGNDTNMVKITVTVYWQDDGEKSFQTASIKSRN
ncbi:MAG: hypothetical protein HW405_864, partial [Candidatus Berkelbacteria bacterium]|nr:hypothetical protein [Candidatus Berkelbacteria bacterium]